MVCTNVIYWWREQIKHFSVYEEFNKMPIDVFLEWHLPEKELQIEENITLKTFIYEQTISYFKKEELISVHKNLVQRPLKIVLDLINTLILYK